MKSAKEKKTEKKITRQEALKKVGRYAAVTALAAVVILSPKESQAQSSSPTYRGRNY